MLTLLSGFAAHEREMIRERSIAGTNRLAQAGVWLGGIVPFGYRKEGEKRDTKLVIADQAMPEKGVSEADIVRQIYRMAAEDRLSWRVIAEHLTRQVCLARIRETTGFCSEANAGSPPRASGEPVASATSSFSPTYKGRHEYGKRSGSREKKLIVRNVPALVGEETWNRAQQALSEHFVCGPRNAKNRYLLRGLRSAGNVP